MFRQQREMKRKMEEEVKFKGRSASDNTPNEGTAMDRIKKEEKENQLLHSQLKQRKKKRLLKKKKKKRLSLLKKSLLLKNLFLQD